MIYIKKPTLTTHAPINAVIPKPLYTFNELVSFSFSNNFNSSSLNVTIEGG
jgi:hypothetical protein